MAKIGFIGMGNMGGAILKGLLGSIEKKDLLFSCAHAEHGAAVEAETGAAYKKTNAEVAAEADVIVLAVKPVIFPKVLAEIKDEVKGDKIIISLAPGWSLAKLSDSLGGFQRVVRAMPNTPALVGEGMTGVAYEDAAFSKEDEALIGMIFGAVGAMKRVEERLMDAVVAVSGSSPAFVYLFIDAIADAGVRYGLKKSDALEMAAKTVLGSAKMVLESGQHPAALKDAVCSPGGTTIAGVCALDEAGFRNAVIKGCEAVYNKCIGKE